MSIPEKETSSEKSDFGSDIWWEVSLSYAAALLFCCRDRGRISVFRVIITMQNIGDDGFGAA